MLEIKEGAYKGQTVFLIGTGPSLTPHQMRLVKPFHTIGCGGLPLWDELPYAPQAFCVNEEVTFTEVHRFVEQTPLWEQSQLFVTFPVPMEHYPTVDSPHTRYGTKSPLLVPSERWRLFHHTHGEEMADVGLRVEIEKGRVTWCRDASGFMLPLQLALFMGFSRIVLLGFDFTNGGFLDGQTFVYMGGMRREIDYRRLGRSLDSITRTCGHKGVELVNCSPGATQVGTLSQKDLYGVLGFTPGDTSKDACATILDTLRQYNGASVRFTWEGAEPGITLSGWMDDWHMMVEFRCPRTDEVIDRWFEDQRHDAVDCLHNWFMEHRLWSLPRKAVLV